MFNKRKFSPILMGVFIIGAIVARVIPHPPNFTPIAALALFSGAHFSGKAKFLVPLVAMIVSDLIIGLHATIPYVYGSFLIVIMLGIMLKANPSLSKLVGYSLTSSVLFFLITNYGVWSTGTIYAKNTQGLISSYVMGIPFFRNNLIGDLFFSFGLFYGLKFADSVSSKLLSRLNISNQG